ncbi:uncharacterized protein BO97DRAFT_429486 [Aspergillus homomorphus CBS 101889]|uniref:Uncharacterized protein n=1 Tax=Aspergillus homomorphus (strain CBS 101889) TaxID=1450537 RepID=A0A395HHI6_ASPHC|nr:hypothetical protein BO97DRAFT_429486 [Aspergillus homomorphus CBS 101889]RAL07277.1 hypothetical protein BO97DRAFT_429486 [Aspergillus homomorphus CBS 101889]
MRQPPSLPHLTSRCCHILTFARAWIPAEQLAASIRTTTSATIITSQNGRDLDHRITAYHRFLAKSANNHLPFPTGTGIVKDPEMKMDPEMKISSVSSLSSSPVCIALLVTVSLATSVPGPYSRRVSSAGSQDPDDPVGSTVGWTLTGVRSVTLYFRIEFPFAGR